jgi:hypothetical protein
MKIFFSASVKGGRTNQSKFEVIVRELQRYGEVYSSHVADPEISHYGETGLSAQEILTRELSALAACDIVVAEVSTPSLGVGYLIARAISLGKRVIVLYSGTNTLKLSAIIQGNPGIEVLTYMTDVEIEKIIKGALESRV